MQVTLSRVTLAFLCLAPLALARGGPQVMRAPLRAHWRAIVLLGVLNFAGSQILALTALIFLPASVNSVLNNTHPLWIAIGTALLLPSRRPTLLVVGSLIALTGVIVIFAPDVLRSTSAQAISPIGVTLSLAGSGVIALGTVLGRHIVPGHDPVAVAALGMAAAIPPVLALTLVSGGLQPILDADASTRSLLLYVGIGCTAVNVALWYYGLKYMSAAGASAFQYLIPPIGVVLAAIFLGEPLTLSLLLGTLCIVLGLAATQVAMYSGTKRSFD
jgi:drug/metabolite transporter (DMT)-like permease